MHRAVLLLLLLCLPGVSQFETDPARSGRMGTGEHDVKLPNGKSQTEAILKADHEKDLKEASQLADLADSFRDDLKKQDSHVLAIGSLKKLQEIEKLARRIEGRMKRY